MVWVNRKFLVKLNRRLRFRRERWYWRFFEQAIPRSLQTRKTRPNRYGDGENPVSVAYAAVDLAGRIFSDLSNHGVITWCRRNYRVSGSASE